MRTSPRRALTALSLALSTGCAPPDAPARLEDLCGFLFDNMGEEDDEALVEGLTNLRAWLDQGENYALTQEGYSIYELEQEAVSDLDKRDRSTSDLIGAAVVNDHGHGVQKVVRALTVTDQMKVYEDNYEDYERNFDRDPSCFLDKECLSIKANTRTDSKIAGADITTFNRLEFQWVDVDGTWVMMRRNWLKTPADATVLGTDIVLEAQYFLGVTMPWKGRTAYLIATWMDADYGALPVSDDFIKGEIVKTMRKEGEQLEEYLDGR